MAARRPTSRSRGVRRAPIGPAFSRQPSRAALARRRAIAVLAITILVLGIGLVARRFWPGAVHTGSAAAHGARILHYDVRSRFTHRTLAQTAAIPADAGPRPPLLVFLHGRGKHGNDSNSNGDFYAALQRSASARRSSSSPTAASTPSARAATGGATSSTRSSRVLSSGCTATPSASRSAASRWAAAAPATTGTRVTPSTCASRRC